VSPKKTKRFRGTQLPTRKMVEAIAFQGSVLALNAALESARDSEAAKEFPLVAEEVRKLARSCARAARDTASLMEHEAGSPRPRQARGFAQIVKAISQMELAAPKKDIAESASGESAGDEQAAESEILRCLASRLTAFAGNSGAAKASSAH
jgi:methyl-accepting chemotaxis protein